MAININNKKTKLSDEASIYTSHKTVSEKETWKKMNRSEKRTHFKEYYLTPVLVGILVVCIAGFLVYDAVSSYRDIVLLTAVINDHFDEETLSDFNTDLLDHLGGNDKKEKVSIEDDYMLSGSNGAEALKGSEKITSYIYAKQLDTIIADEEYFNHYASLGCFHDLRTILTEEQLLKYADYLYYPELEENNDPNAPSGLQTIRPSETYPCGIILSNSPVYSSLEGAQSKPIMGIVVTSGRLDNALSFLEYLFPDVN